MLNALQDDQRGTAQQVVGAVLQTPSPSDREWMVDDGGLVPAAIAASELLADVLRDDRDFLSKLRIPTLLLFGGKSTMNSAGAARFMAEQIPGARLHVFEQSGHCPFYQEPDGPAHMTGNFFWEGHVRQVQLIRPCLRDQLASLIRPTRDLVPLLVVQLPELKLRRRIRRPEDARRVNCLQAPRLPVVAISPMRPGRSIPFDTNRQGGRRIVPSSRPYPQAVPTPQAPRDLGERRTHAHSRRR